MQKIATLLPIVAALTAVLLGVMVGMGWWLDIVALKSVLPGLPSMKPSTASMLVALGVALLFSQSDQRPIHKFVALFGAAYVVLLGAAYIYAQAGIEALSPWALAPSRMTSLSLVLLGVAVLLLQARRPPVVLVTWTAIFGGVLALHRLLSMLMGMGAMQVNGPFGSMGLNTAFGIFMLATCGILMHPRLPMVGQFFADTLRGRLLRLMMPWSAFAPTLVLALASWYIGDTVHDASSVVVMVAGFSIAITTAVWLIAHKLQLADDERNLAVEKLREGEDLTLSIIDSLNGSIAVLDEQGKIIQVNRSWRDFAAHNNGSIETLVGMGLNYFDVCRKAAALPDEGAREALEGIRAVLAGELPHYYLEYPCHSPEQQRWFLLQVTPLIGTLRGVVANHIDITARKLAEASMNVALTKYKSLFDAIPLGITVTDEAGNIVETNLAAAKLLGVPQEVHRQRRLGSPEWHLVRKDGTRMPPDDYPSMRALREKRRIENMELGVVKPDSATTWLSVSASPIPLQGYGVVVIYGDIGERMHAERSLRIEQQHAQEERDRTQLYLDVVEVFIVVLDENARIQRINRKGCEILGWSEAELLGQPWLNYCAEYVRDVWNIYHKELMADRVTSEKMSEYPVISRGGGELLIDWRRHVLRDAAGKAYGTVSSGLDVTAERLVQRTLAQYQDDLELLVKARTSELESSEEKLRLILDSSMEGIFGLDAEGRFTFVNPAACQMLGYSSGQLIGQFAHPLIHHTLADGSYCPAEKCPILSVLRENLLVRGDEEVLWRSDGQPIPVEFTAASVHKLGVIIGAVASFHDISLRKATEAATQTALQEARRLAQVRSDFLANMSHEIRTPLNGVIGLAQVGLRSSKGRKSYNSFNRILDSGQLLLSVVNDILDFSKIEAGKLVIEHAPFVLGETLDHAMDMVAPRAFSKGLALELAEAVNLPGSVVGDQMRLTQVLTNLTSNAVKFTQHGKIRLSVQIGAAQTGAPGIMFQLEDSGIGMTGEQMARLFQPFEQADGSTTRRFGGTGLGLTICKRLVDAMDGEIQVESHLGAGTIFKVWLPLLAAQASPLPAPASLCMVLAGFEAPEIEGLCAALQARGMRAVAVPLADAFDQPAADLIVLAGDALRGKVDISALTLALQKKQRVAVVMTPGMEGKLSFRIQEQVEILYRPLRVRHLVMAATREMLHKAAIHASERLAGLRVLAAEDNELNQIVLEDILTLEGAVVTLAENGREALDRLREQGEQAFDVVLTDIQMPEMDGYELARQVIALAPGLPIIGLTANAMPEDREHCLAAGMVEHVVKPIDIDALVDAILRHVASQPAITPGSTPVAAAQAAPVGVRAQEAMPWAEHEIIDWAALDQRFNGRQDFIAKLVSTTLASHAATPATLREAAGRADLEAVAFIAHSLKGLGGNLFARQVNELGARTESGARSGDPGAVALGAQLADAMESLLNALTVRGQDENINTKGKQP